MKRIILIFGLLIAIAASANATTWFPSKHKCPICKHKHEYQEIGSYGSYIYSWPSKYQFIYWPYTSSPFAYSCPKCHFSTYMWDFDSIPENKIDTLTIFLKTVKLEKKIKDYQDIPTTTRLEIAKDVYQILGREKKFWCKFYRVLAYHYDLEDNALKAKEARVKAIHIGRQMLSDTTYQGQEKETLIIMAAMHHFTEQNDSADIYLKEANELSYQNSTEEAEDVERYDAYLSEFIIEYKNIMRKDEDEE